ncbi:MAG: hypothetical protein IJK59_08740 [Firmicutes bacterium]|nr:hypothetical protein [Bacillota bacterium]MBQ6012501.1 hypothetical protein [Bacillota bacterium]MBQ6261320.1 hypothetical protein [Bacillota bacterium]MBR0115118.1 hypothetical protein [Bacillota bacterium]
MKGNEYNDLWAVINNAEGSLVERLPERFLEFVKDSMVPGAEPDSGLTISGGEPVVPDAAKDLLAALYLTYWAESAGERRSFAEHLHANELAYAKEEPRPMTEEEYQAFLKDFDDWNDLFGPIPFWAQSRGWQPERCFEIAPDDESSHLTAWDVGLKEVYVTREQREAILKEAQQWVLVADTEEEETLYWHDNDSSSWSSTEEIEDFYKRAVVVKDGHFYGALVNTELRAGMGLSVYRDEEYGILFTDGTKAGRTYEHESRSSDESSYSKTTTYTLKKK